MQRLPLRPRAPHRRGPTRWRRRAAGSARAPPGEGEEGCHHETGQPEREWPDQIDGAVRQRVNGGGRDRLDGGAKEPLERRADEVGRHPRALARVPLAVVLGERVPHHRREPRLVDPGRVRDVVAEDCRDIVVAGEQVDVVNRVVEERGIVTQPLPHGKRIARERLVVENRWVDCRADVHTTFSGKWHARTVGRRTSLGEDRTLDVCSAPAAFQQRDAKMQPGTGFVRSGSSPSSLIRRRSRSSAGIRDRHGREQRDRVRMLRRGEDLVRVGDLDELAAVHHGNPVAHVPNGREIVRDEQVGEAEPALQVHQQVEDLRPHGDVERRDRLVADDQRRVGGERPCDRDALPLSARELERAPLAEVRLEPDELEQLGDAAAVLPGRAAVEQHQRLGDDLVDRHQRVERVARILEDHLHPAPLLRRDAAVAGLERAPVERRPRRGFASVRPSRSRATVDLPGARLADEPEGLAAPDLEGYALDGAQPALARAATAPRAR